jgi:hypothetical protein
MKKFLAIPAVVAALIGASTAFSGCSAVKKYNAKLYANATEWVSEQVLSQNVTRGMPIGEGKYAQGEAYPEEIEYLVNSQEELDELFASFPVKVDFNKKQVAVCFFTNSYSGQYKIEDMERDGYEMEFDLDLKNEGCGGEQPIAPTQRVIAITFDRLAGITSVDFSVD